MKTPTKPRHKFTPPTEDEVTDYAAGLNIAEPREIARRFTVREKLRSENVDDRAITKFLTDAIDKSPTAAHTAYYAQLLKQQHEIRRLRAFLREADRRLDEQPADMVQAELMRQLEKNDADPAKDGITFAEATDKAVETFKRIAHGNPGIKTGLPFMDSAGGIQRKRLNFDRLDGGRVKRCAKPVTVRQAI